MMAEINVTPFVDVMLVLLIIFMVTAPMMQRGIDVNLPVSRRSQAIADERVTITIPLSFQQDRQVMLNEEMVTIDVLAERLRQAMASNTDKGVFLRAAAEIRFQELVVIMDQLRAAGVQDMGIVTDIPERQ